MHLKVNKGRDGVARLYLYETTYDKDPATGKHRISSHLWKSLGRLDDLQKQFDDPIAYYKAYCEELNKQKTVEKEDLKMIPQPPVYLDTEMDLTRRNIQNVGYVIFKQLYLDLELNVFWNRRCKNRSIQYSVDRIFRLLVFGRAVYPASKKGTYDNRYRFFEGFNGFNLQNVYRALDIIADNQEALQKWIFDHSEDMVKRDMSVTYFDCTNYYFDIGVPDIDTLDDDGHPIDENGAPTDPKYRKRGAEKNHRPDPIVGMGLLTDRNGIPLAFDLFPGNESEKVHMRPVLNRVKNEFTDCRTIIVADRGLNTSDNIYWINGDNLGDHDPRDGYVYGQSIRGADAEFKAWTLADGYRTDDIIDDDGNKIKFKHKSRIARKVLHVHVTDPNGKERPEIPTPVDQKQMVYYSEKYAKKQKAQRDTMIKRAKELIANPKKYNRVTSAGSAAYVLNIAFDSKTGEVIEGKELLLNEGLIREQEKFDGYYSIVTSELDMDDLELRDIYRGLSRIEETFKISKHDFDSRPVFVWTTKHIDAHFTTCFTALFLVRLLQAKLEYKYPIGQVLKSIREYNCTKMENGTYRFEYYDEILQACGQALDMKLNLQYRTLEQMRRFLRY